MAEDFFTRKYEDSYGVELIERTNYHFDENASVTEAFFAVHAQFDMLVEDHEIFINDGEHQIQEKWTPELVLAAIDEVAVLAKKQNSPAWPMLMALASAMRVMVRTAVVMPSTEFKADPADGIPPGLYKLLEREDARPFDFAVAAVSNDLAPDSMIGAAVTAERARCETTIKDRIKDLLNGGSPDDLDSEEGWAYEILERARVEITGESVPVVEDEKTGEPAPAVEDEKTAGSES